MLQHKVQLQFLLVLLVGGILLSFFILSPFLASVTLAAIFAVVLNPLYERLLKVFGNRKAISALSTVIITILCILAPLAILGTQIFKEALQVYGSITEVNSTQNMLVTVINSLGKIAEDFLPGSGFFFNNLSTNVDIYVKQGFTWLINHFGTAVSSASSLLLSFFIFLISFYYLLIDGLKLKQEIIKLSPLDDSDDKVVFDRLKSAVDSVVKGSLLIALIQGVLTAVGFTLFGVPNAVLWGTLTMIAALIPGIGTALVLFPAVLYLFIVGSTLSALGLIAWGLFAVGLIDNMLYPKLVGRELKMHPLIVLLSVLGGLAFFGPIGIFLGPITISLLFAFIYIYSYFVSGSTAQL